MDNSSDIAKIVQAAALAQVNLSSNQAEQKWKQFSSDENEQWLDVNEETLGLFKMWLRQ